MLTHESFEDIMGRVCGRETPSGGNKGILTFADQFTITKTEHRKEKTPKRLRQKTRAQKERKKSKLNNEIKGRKNAEAQ